MNSTFGIKKLLIYKSHIFPETRKPIRSIPEYLLIKNVDLDRQKARKMYQLLDEQEKKRLRQQKDIQNDEINLELQKYYRKYIQPFQTCPDYYSMLFQYAVKKVNYLVDGKRIKEDIEEPFFLTKKEIKSIAKDVMHESASQEQEVNPNLISNRTPPKTPIKSTLQSNLHTSIQNQPLTQQKKKLLFQIYRHLYPSQRLQIHNRFTKLYSQFLIKQQGVSTQLLDQRITHLKPFLFVTPVELYQSKNPEIGIEECKRILVNDVNEREKANFQFIRTLETRERENQIVEKRFGVNIAQIWYNYRYQYYKLDKYQSFYSMLKNG